MTRVVGKESVSGTGSRRKGAKGKQVLHETVILNPVHVSGFEAHHSTVVSRGYQLDN